jgi:hypothetical protein
LRNRDPGIEAAVVAFKVGLVDPLQAREVERSGRRQPVTKIG